MSSLIPGIDYVGVATIFCCTDGNGRILLSKRGQHARDEQGHWEFGSGQLEYGEQPEEGVLREVREEFSCSGKILKALPPYTLNRERDNRKSSWLLLPFVIKVDPGEVKIGDPKVTDMLQWFTFDSLPSPLHPNAPHAAEMYRTALSL